MTKFKFLRRFVSTLSASMLMLGMLTFVPGAFASTLKLTGALPDTFNYIKDSTVDFNVGMSDNNAVVKVDFKVKGPLDNNPTTKLISSQNYNGNMLLPFSWNGKFDGVFVKPGQYQAIFEGADNTPTHTFWVVNAEPALNFDPKPVNTYTIGSGDFVFPVELTGFKSNTEVIFSLEKKGSNNPMQDSHTYTGNGTFNFVWNGKINGANPDPGTYVATFSGKDKDGNPVKELAFEFSVLNPIIIDPLTKLEFSPAYDTEYTQNSGDYALSVKLSGYASDTTVTVAVLNNDSNLYIPVDSYVYKANGTHEFSWDASNYALGTYKFQVTGVNQKNVPTNTLNGQFKVVADASTCVGYQDVSKNSSACAALTWLKQEGIMEGEGDGTFFNPSGEFNRAAAAKVALEAYNKYNDNLDYCNGKNPFPDTDRKAWYGNYICRAAALDVVTGYSAGPDAGNFVPGRAVSVIEMFAILLRPLNEIFPFGPSYTGLASDQWYSPYAKESKDNAYYPGNSLSPTKAASRLEVANYLYELHLDGKI